MLTEIGAEFTHVLAKTVCSFKRQFYYLSSNVLVVISFLLKFIINYLSDIFITKALLLNCA